MKRVKIGEPLVYHVHGEQGGEDSGRLLGTVALMFDGMTFSRGFSIPSFLDIPTKKEGTKRASSRAKHAYYSKSSSKIIRTADGGSFGWYYQNENDELAIEAIFLFLDRVDLSSDRPDSNVEDLFTHKSQHMIELTPFEIHLVKHFTEWEDEYNEYAKR